jgi:hypothetical protein
MLVVFVEADGEERDVCEHGFDRRREFSLCFPVFFEVRYVSGDKTDQRDGVG